MFQPNYFFSLLFSSRFLVSHLCLSSSLLLCLLLFHLLLSCLASPLLSSSCDVVCDVLLCCGSACVVLCFVVVWCCWWSWCVFGVCVWCAVCVVRHAEENRGHSACVDSKRLRVYMLFNMCACCRHTRGRSECTHGCVFESTHGVGLQFS